MRIKMGGPDYTIAARQRKLVEREQAAGISRVTLRVPTEHKAALAAYAARLVTEHKAKSHTEQKRKAK